MRDDPIKRLHAANPIRQTLSAPAFTALRDRIIGDEQPLDAAGPASPRPRRARLRLTGALSAVAVVAVVVVVAGGAIVLLGHHSGIRPPATMSTGLPPVPSMGPANHQAFAFLLKAQRSVSQSTRVCQPGRVPAPAHGLAPGKPSRALRRSFGVLRLPASASPTRQPGSGRFGQVFAGYARLARQGTVVVFPVRLTRSDPLLDSAHCRQLIYQALQAEVRGQPPEVRDRALRVGAEQLADNRYIVEHRNAGICVSAGGSGIGCEAYLSATTGGLLQSGGTDMRGASWAYLVPDGITSITAHYPAESPTAGSGRHVAAATVTAKVINNVAVWRMPKEPGDLFPDQIRWRAADGRTVRTVYP